MMRSKQNLAKASDDESPS